MSAPRVFDQFLGRLGLLDGKSIGAALVTAAYIPAGTDTTIDSITGEASGTGYTRQTFDCDYVDNVARIADADEWPSFDASDLDDPHVGVVTYYADSGGDHLKLISYIPYDEQPGISGWLFEPLNGFAKASNKDYTATGVLTIVAGDNITVDATDPANPIVSSTGGGGGGGSSQVGSNRVTPADGDTVALSQSVITIVSLPATPGAAVTLTAGSPATSPEFWAILRREAFGFDTYALTFPGEYHDPDGLLAEDGSATAVVLHLVPDKYGDGTPVWATKIEPLDGGAVTFYDLETYAANTLATAEGYTDSAVDAHVAATDPHGDRAYTDAQVTAALATFDFKASARAASTSNITLSGAQTIDGVAVIGGDRVLVAGQSTGSQNGIYVAASGSWARAADANASSEVTSGMAVGVTEGTSNGDAFWLLTTNDPITLGSTALSFTKLPMVAGLSPSANLSDLTNAATARTNLGVAIGTDVLAPNGSGASLTGIPESAVTNLTTDLAAKAPLASPTFTGTPAAPTASAGTNTTQLASTAFVTAAVLANRLHPTAVKTSAYTAAAADYVRVDTTSGVVVITLPTAPADGTEIAVKRVAGATNAVTVNAGGSDTFNTTGGATSASLSLLLQAQLYNYSASDGVWIAATSNATTQLDSRYMDLTNAQTIAGVKTFSSSPIVPTPTTAFQAAPKGYIDGLRVRKRKQTDQTKNANTTLADITDMTFSIAASEEWIGRAALMVASVNSTADLDIALTVPSGATMLINAYSVRGIDALLQTYNAITSSGTRLSLQIFGAAGPTVSLVIVEFSVLNSTNAGTVALQFSQGTSNATDTTIKAGSTFYADRTA